MSALCLGAGNVTTQHAEWRHCVNIGSCTTWVFVTTCVFTFAISAWTWNWSTEQTSNSAWNSANLERRLLKWYDVRIETASRARCFEWHAHFKRDRTLLEDDERSGWTSTSSTPKNVETFRQLVHEDRRRTIKDIATIVNVSYGTVQTILTCDLNMHRIAAKFVPRLLTPEQKEHRVAICQELCQCAVDDPTFMSRVITGDESWVYGYDPETKQQSSQWKSPGSPRLKKVRQSRSATKSMLIVFFDIRGIVHHEFVPEAQTVTAEFYCNVLRHLREDIRQKRPELWCAGNWLLHDDNAPSHRALVTHEFLAHKGIITLPHPPYSPDLAPCDFLLFPKMKLQLKGHRFDRVEEIQRESQNVLGTLWEQDFQHAFQQWQRRWDRCVAAQGNILKEMLPKLK